MTIDPNKFTDQEWLELYNATGLVPSRSAEERADAIPFECSCREALEAAKLCQVKAAQILAGRFGPPTGEDRNEAWAADLIGAAIVLALECKLQLQEQPV